MKYMRRKITRILYIFYMVLLFVFLINSHLVIAQTHLSGTVMLNRESGIFVCEFEI